MLMTQTQIDQEFLKHTPPLDMEFINSVSDAGSKEVNKPWFTGWKGLFRGQNFYYPSDDMAVEVGDELPVYVGQWIYFNAPDGKKVDKAFYVNLPGMESGTAVIGAVFDIGDERVEATVSPEESSRLIQEGYYRLMALLNEEKAA